MMSEGKGRTREADQEAMQPRESERRDGDPGVRVLVSPASAADAEGSLPVTPSLAVPSLMTCAAKNLKEDERRKETVTHGCCCSFCQDTLADKPIKRQMVLSTVAGVELSAPSTSRQQQQQSAASSLLP